MVKFTVPDSDSDSDSDSDDLTNAEEPSPKLIPALKIKKKSAAPHAGGGGARAEGGDLRAAVSGELAGPQYATSMTGLDAIEVERIFNNDMDRLDRGPLGYGYGLSDEEEEEKESETLPDVKLLEDLQARLNVACTAGEQPNSLNKEVQIVRNTVANEKCVLLSIEKIRRMHKASKTTENTDLEIDATKSQQIAAKCNTHLFTYYDTPQKRMVALRRSCDDYGFHESVPTYTVDETTQLQSAIDRNTVTEGLGFMGLRRYIKLATSSEPTSDMWDENYRKKQLCAHLNKMMTCAEQYESRMPFSDLKVLLDRNEDLLVLGVTSNRDWITHLVKKEGEHKETVEKIIKQYECESPYNTCAFNRVCHKLQIAERKRCLELNLELDTKPTPNVSDIRVLRHRLQATIDQCQTFTFPPEPQWSLQNVKDMLGPLPTQTAIATTGFDYDVRQLESYKQIATTRWQRKMPKTINGWLEVTRLNLKLQMPQHRETCDSVSIFCKEVNAAMQNEIDAAMKCLNLNQPPADDGGPVEQVGPNGVVIKKHKNIQAAAKSMGIHDWRAWESNILSGHATLLDQDWKSNTLSNRARGFIWRFCPALPDLHVLQKSCFVLCNAAFIDTDTDITKFCDRWDTACYLFNEHGSFLDNAILYDINASWERCNKNPCFRIKPDANTIDAKDEYDYKATATLPGKTDPKLVLFSDTVRHNDMLIEKVKVLQQEATEQSYCDFVIADSAIEMRRINSIEIVKIGPLSEYFKCRITSHGLAWLNIYMAAVKQTRGESDGVARRGDIAANIHQPMFEKKPRKDHDTLPTGRTEALFAALQQMCERPEDLLQTINDILVVKQLYYGKGRTLCRLPLYHSAVLHDGTITVTTTDCACVNVQRLLAANTFFARESITNIVAIKKSLEYTQRFVLPTSVAPFTLAVRKCLNALQQRKFPVSVLANNKWSELARIYDTNNKLIIPLDVCAHLLSMCVAGEQLGWVVKLHCLLVNNIHEKMDMAPFYTPDRESQLTDQLIPQGMSFWRTKSNRDTLTKPLLKCKEFLATQQVQALRLISWVAYPHQIEVLHAQIAATSVLHTYENVWHDNATHNDMEKITDIADMYCATKTEPAAAIATAVPSEQTAIVTAIPPVDFPVPNTKMSLSIAVHTNNVDLSVEDLNTSLCNSVWKSIFKPFELSKPVTPLDCREHEKQTYDIHKVKYDEKVEVVALWRMLYCMFGTKQEQLKRVQRKQEQLKRVQRQLKQKPAIYKDLYIQTKTELKLKILDGFPSAAKVIKEVLQTNRHVCNLSITAQNQLIVQFEYNAAQEPTAKPMFELQLQSAILDCMSHLPKPKELWSKSEYQPAVAKLLSCFDNAKTFASVSDPGIVTDYNMLAHFQTIYQKLKSYKITLQNIQRNFNKGNVTELRNVTKTVSALKNITENYADKLQQFEKNIDVYKSRKESATQHDEEYYDSDLTLDQIVGQVQQLAFVSKVNRSTIVYYPSEQNNLLDMHDSESRMSLMLNLHRRYLNRAQNACKHWVTCPTCKQIRLLKSAFILYDSPFSHTSDEYGKDKRKIIDAYKETSRKITKTKCIGCTDGVLNVIKPPQAPIPNDIATHAQADWLLSGQVQRINLSYTQVTPLTYNNVAKFLMNTLTSIPLSESTIQSVIQNYTANNSFTVNGVVFSSIEGWIVKYCTKQFECKMADVAIDTDKVTIKVTCIAALLAMGNIVGSGVDALPEFADNIDTESDAIRQELQQVGQQYVKAQEQIQAVRDETVYCWCWYGYDERWFISSVKPKDASTVEEDKHLSAAHSIDKRLATPDLAAEWHVTPYKYPRVVPRDLIIVPTPPGAADAASGFTITEFTGSIINGSFSKTKKITNNKPVYVKINSKDDTFVIEKAQILEDKLEDLTERYRAVEAEIKYAPPPEANVEVFKGLNCHKIIDDMAAKHNSRFANRAKLIEYYQDNCEGMPMDAKTTLQRVIVTAALIDDISARAATFSLERTQMLKSYCSMLDINDFQPFEAIYKYLNTIAELEDATARVLMIITARERKQLASSSFQQAMLQHLTCVYIEHHTSNVTGNNLIVRAANTPDIRRRTLEDSDSANSGKLTQLKLVLQGAKNNLSRLPEGSDAHTAAVEEIRLLELDERNLEEQRAPEDSDSANSGKLTQLKLLLQGARNKLSRLPEGSDAHAAAVEEVRLWERDERKLEEQRASEEYHDSDLTLDQIAAPPADTKISNRFKLFYAAVTDTLDAKQVSRPSKASAPATPGPAAAAGGANTPNSAINARITQLEQTLADTKEDQKKLTPKSDEYVTANEAIQRLQFELIPQLKQEKRLQTRAREQESGRQLGRAGTGKRTQVRKTARRTQFAPVPTEDQGNAQLVQTEDQSNALTCLNNLEAAEKRVQESLSDYVKARDTARAADIAETIEKLKVALHRRYNPQYNALDTIISFCNNTDYSDQLRTSCKQWYIIRANNLKQLNACYSTTDPNTNDDIRKWIREAQIENVQLDCSNNIDISTVKLNVQAHQTQNCDARKNLINEHVLEAAVDFVTSNTVFGKYQDAHCMTRRHDHDTIYRLAVAIGLQSTDYNEYEDIASAVFGSGDETIAQSTRKTLARSTAMLVRGQLGLDFEYLFSNPNQYLFTHVDGYGIELVTKVILQPRLKTNNMLELETEVGFAMCCESHLTAEQQLFEYERDQDMDVVVTHDPHRVFELNDKVNYENKEWTIVEVYYEQEWVVEEDSDYVTIEQNREQRNIFRPGWPSIGHKRGLVCNLHNNTISVRVTEAYNGSAANFKDDLRTACVHYLKKHRVENKTDYLNHTVAYTNLDGPSNYYTFTDTDIITSIPARQVPLKPGAYTEPRLPWHARFPGQGSQYLAKVLEMREMTEVEKLNANEPSAGVNPLSLAYRETDINALVHRPDIKTHVLQFAAKYSWKTKEKHSYVILNQGVITASSMYDERMLRLHEQHNSDLQRRNVMLQTAYETIPDYLPFVTKESAQYKHMQLNCGLASVITMLKGDNGIVDGKPETLKRIKSIIIRLRENNLWYIDLKPENLIMVKGVLNLIDLDALVSDPSTCPLYASYEIWNEIPPDECADKQALQSYYTYHTLMHSYVCCLMLVATDSTVEHIYSVLDKTTYALHERTENMFIFEKMSRLQAQFLLDSYDDNVFLLRRLYTVTESAFCTRYQKAMYEQLGENYNNDSINFFVLSYKTGHNCYEHIECLQIINTELEEQGAPEEYYDSDLTLDQIAAPPADTPGIRRRTLEDSDSANSGKLTQLKLLLQGARNKLSRLPEGSDAHAAAVEEVRLWELDERKLEEQGAPAAPPDSVYDDNLGLIQDRLETARSKLLVPGLSMRDYLAASKEVKELEKEELEAPEIPITGLNHHVYWSVNRADINNFGKEDGKEYTLEAFAEYLQTTLKRRPIINHAASKSKMSALLTLANVVTSDEHQCVELQSWFNSIESAADTILDNKYPHTVCL